MAAPAQTALQGTLSREKAEHLFDLYNDFLANKDLYRSIQGDFFDSVDRCPYDWSKFDVQFSSDDINSIYAKYDIIQLRPIDPDCKVLIVGCGKKPLVNSGGSPMSSEEAAKYYIRHTHDGAITINPDLASNPDIVGVFGAQRFPMLKDGQFDLIVIESTGIEDTNIGRDELNRLASKTALVVGTLGDHLGRPFSWADNAKNVWAYDYVPADPIIDLTQHPSFLTPPAASQDK